MKHLQIIGWLAVGLLVILSIVVAVWAAVQGTL